MAQPRTVGIVKAEMAVAFRARDFKALTSLMWEARYDAACTAFAAQLFEQHEGCTRSRAERDAFSQSAATAGTLDVLLEALDYYHLDDHVRQSNVEVLRSSLAALAMLCRDQTSIIATMASRFHNLVVIVIRSVETHPDDAVLAGNACRLLYYLTSAEHLNAGPSYFLRLFATARMHIRDPIVVGWAFSALDVLARYETILAHLDAVISDVIPFVLEALNLHRSVVRVVERGCGILTVACQPLQGSQRAYSLGALDALVRVLRDAVTMRTTLHACQACSRIVLNLPIHVQRQSLNTRFITRMCVSLLLRVCPLGARSDELEDIDVEIALFSLLNLVHTSGDDAIEAIRAGALPAVRHALATSSYHKVKQFGKPLYACLVAAEQAEGKTAAAAAAAAAAADAAAAELLAAEEAERAARSRAAAKRARKKKRGGRGGAAAAGNEASLAAAPSLTQQISNDVLPGAAPPPQVGEAAAAAQSQVSQTSAVGVPTAPPSPPGQHQQPAQPAEPQAAAAASEAAASDVADASLPRRLAALDLESDAAQEATPAAAMAHGRQRECCICLDSVAAEELWILLPCAHRCVCAGCAGALMAAPEPARGCPKCRKPLAAVSRVFED